MIREFDDSYEADAAAHMMRSGQVSSRTDPAGLSAPRLVARLYRTADASLRPRLLACLLRPLGTLSLMVVAGGAFASYLQHGRRMEAIGELEDFARVSGDHVAALASFVEQVNPQVLDQFAQLAADNALGFAAFSTATVVLLYEVLRRRSGTPAEVSNTIEGEGR
jgi:hypothetical protein